MRIVLGRAVGSAAPLLGAAAGAFLAVRDQAAAPVGRATAAACTSDLPATSARCATDHAVADVSPFVGPALVGGAVGLLLAIAVLVLLGAMRRAARPRPVAPAAALPPAWVVLPTGDRAGSRS